ncbi:hypothetical protein PINS_up001649 [Pythium insidiosum]|nr:hypothetical protein PINS_up001649 [Pythium insidiosum]
MGANIGTCVTCILVAFAQVSNRRHFERAIAAAITHDMYNVWSVIVMFPIEELFHPLEKLSRAMSNARTNQGAFANPIETIVRALTERLLVVDKSSIYAIATGQRACGSDISFLEGGAFAHSDLSDQAIGILVMVLGLIVLAAALSTLIRMMARVFLGATKRVIAEALDCNGYLNILIGTALTFAVHSSTLVTSTLTPMAGLGVVTQEQVYPLVIGANLGTTATALLASLVTGKKDAVAIALVHFWFNVFGIFLFYPIAVTRKPILEPARQIAQWSAAWPLVAVVFVLMSFLGIPLIFVGLMYATKSRDAGVRVLGWSCVVAIVMASAVTVMFIYRWGGRERWNALLDRKSERHERHDHEEPATKRSSIDDIEDLLDTSPQSQRGSLYQAVLERRSTHSS